MKRKLILGAVLGLALVLWLTIGASAAFAAPTCIDCHAAPPAGPPAPHGVLVAAVTDCTICHVGMTPHPTMYKTPVLLLEGAPSDTGYVLEGAFGHPGWKLGWVLAGFPGATVYLQQRLWGATSFTDLTTATTGTTQPDIGKFSYTVAMPGAYAAYRAIARGLSGLASPLDGTWLPTVVVLLPKPKITVKYAGLADGILPVGATLKVSGTVAPTGLAGENVRLVLMRLRAGQWVRVATKACAISATDTFAGSYVREHPGTYRIRAQMVAKADLHTATATAWKKFKVK